MLYSYINVIHEDVCILGWSTALRINPTSY